MLLSSCTVLVALLARVSEGLVEPLQSLPGDLTRILDTYHSIGDLTQQPGQLVFWNSMEEYLCKFSKSRPSMTGSEYAFLRDRVRDFMEPLFVQQGQGSRQKRQAFFRPRVRRELRVLSRAERMRYFNAVNALKADTRLRPNIYDVLADFHSGDTIARAHFGPAFPAWHRLYLWLYESFLRLYDPRVTVPFWASVLDNEMENPAESPLWTAAFFGNGVGEPNIGPFRNWRTLNPARVFTRNVGNGPLYSYEGVERIVNRTRNSEILLPTALADSNFETQHGGPHVFVGGSMNRLNEAVRDPIFYSHHAFVDQIWERFRFNQYLNGINPGTDYPFIEGDDRFPDVHRPNETMGFFPNNELNIDYTNAIGYSNIFFRLVQYERVPSCPACGGSPFLFCRRSINRCVSRSVGQMAGRNLEPIGGGGRVKRQADLSTDTCSKPTLINDYDYKRLWTEPQSSAASVVVPLSPQSAIPHNDWVFVPVKIVSKRPKAYKSFNFYSLDDISAQGSQLGSKNAFLKHDSQYAYNNCEKYQDVVGKIKIVSYGLNYEGYAEEYAVVDNRLGASISYGFVPVKRPYGGASEAIIAAFDSCGRVCKPYCKSGSSSDMYIPGGIRATNTQPLQYGNSYAEATLNAWQVPSASACPTLDYNNIPLSFFCEYTDNWVWSSTSSAQGMTRLNPPMNPSPMDRRGSRPTDRFPIQRGGRGMGSRRTARGRRNRGRRVGAPFHGDTNLHSLVPDVLKNYRLQRGKSTML